MVDRGTFNFSIPKRDSAPAGAAIKYSARSYRLWSGQTPGAIFVGTVAGAHLWGVFAQVQRVRRAGAPGWVHHRAGDGAADTGTCRWANKCTGNRPSALTAAGDENSRSWLLRKRCLMQSLN